MGRWLQCQKATIRFQLNPNQSPAEVGEATIVAVLVSINKINLTEWECFIGKWFGMEGDELCKIHVLLLYGEVTATTQRIFIYLFYGE